MLINFVVATNDANHRIKPPPCSTERRDKLLTDARDVYYTALLAFSGFAVRFRFSRSASFFISDFFGDNLASYRIFIYPLFVLATLRLPLTLLIAKGPRVVGIAVLN